MRKTRFASRPIIRLRSMLLGVTGVALIFSVPLLLVWKQVSITSSSMRIEKMNDSLATLSHDIATLRLKCERLSSQERIEQIAQSKLGLDHPAADRIIVVKVPDGDEGHRMEWPREFAEFILRSFKGARG
jgi:cell division protein FtsL